MSDALGVPSFRFWQKFTGITTRLVMMLCFGHVMACGMYWVGHPMHEELVSDGNGGYAYACEATDSCGWVLNEGMDSAGWTKFEQYL
jgi:hypothetical protein